MKQRLLSVSVVAALALGMTAFAMQPSGAAAPLQKCAKIAGSANFTPGLGLVAATNTIKAKGTLGGCLPKAKTGGSGVLTATIKVPNGSCANLATGAQKLKGVAKTTWKNKKFSTYNLSFATGTGAKATQATITGKVATGLFKGHKVTGTIAFTVGAGQDCTPLHPVKSVTFKQVKPWVIL